MSDIVRVSVTLEEDLLERFDRYSKQGRFATRSEAIRQVLHEKLTAHAWLADAVDAVATLTLVYDHHRTHLAEKMLEIQHRHNEMVISTMHVHLTHDQCLEVVVLRGKANELQQMASDLGGLKGIQSAHLVLASTTKP